MTFSDAVTHMAQNAARKSLKGIYGSTAFSFRLRQSVTLQGAARTSGSREGLRGEKGPSLEALQLAQLWQG